MAGLTPEQRRAYRRFSAGLTVALLLVWFAGSYLLGGILAPDLDEVAIAGFPLGYWVAAQGSLLIFAVEVAVYARLMNAKDRALAGREGW